MNNQDIKSKLDEMLELIRTTPLYHGSNSTAEASIRKYGLDPKVRAYNEQELKRLENLLKKARGKDYLRFNDNFARRTCLTTSPETAKVYAKQLPEVWMKLNHNYLFAGNLENLSSAEKTEADNIINSTTNLYKGSHPILVKVDPNAPELKNQNHWLTFQEEIYEHLNKGIRFHNGIDVYANMLDQLETDRYWKLGWKPIIEVRKRIPRKYILEISEIK